MGRRRHRRRLAERADAAAGLSASTPSRDKALAARKTAKLPRSYLGLGRDAATPTSNGFFPYTPATNLLYGLHEAIAMLRRGRPRQRLRAPRPPRRGDAPRGARLGPRDPLPRSARIFAASLTARHDARRARRRRVARKSILERFDMSLGTGLGKVAGKVFRIGHLGDFNDLMLIGTLAGVEMGLRRGRRAAPGGRRRRGDGLSRGRARTRRREGGAARCRVAPPRRSCRPSARGRDGCSSAANPCTVGGIL